MAGTPYVIDSNILIRWVQPSDPDYLITESALEGLANQGAILCYTSQNVAESWNACTRDPRVPGETRQLPTGKRCPGGDYASRRHRRPLHPARHRRAETERAVLYEAASRLQQLLAAEGIFEDEILADFTRFSHEHPNRLHTRVIGSKRPSTSK